MLIPLNANSDVMRMIEAAKNTSEAAITEVQAKLPLVDWSRDDDDGA
jgi:hypothetical protein